MDGTHGPIASMGTSLLLPPLNTTEAETGHTTQLVQQWPEFFAAAFHVF